MDTALSARARGSRAPVGLLVVLAMVALILGVLLARAAVRWAEFVEAPVMGPYWDAVVGLAYVATGLIAWRRRPDNRVGKLMTAVGFAWFIGMAANVTDWNLVRQAFGYTWDHAPKFDVYRLALWFEGASQALLVHLVLAFPTGRLGSRPARIVAGAAYANMVVLGFLRATTFDYLILSRLGFVHQGALGLWISDDTYRTFTRVAQGLWIVILVGVLAILIHRWRSATRAARRMLAPVWLAGAVVAVLVALGVATLVGSLGSQAPLVAGIPVEYPRTSGDQLVFWLSRVGQVLIPIAFLIGLLWMSLARIGVSGLVRRLGEAPPPGALRDALAAALGDPSLEVGYWIPALQEFVDGDGLPLAMPAATGDRSVTVIEREGEQLGALIHDPALDDQTDLLEAVGAAASLAMENERLHAEVRAQLEEVRASRVRIVEAADAERERVERDLHDGAQQRLVNLSLTLRMARDRLDGASPEAAASIDAAAAELRTALAELRELARGIHPAILTEEGLAGALDSLAERSAVPVVIGEVTEERLPPTVEATAYYVVSEALANVAKHSGATQATVDAGVAGGLLRVRVTDDGRGGAEPARGSGLRGLSDRVAALGGSLEVESPSGRGTRVVAEIPCG
jgi:signal transduction histidine kinase